MRSLSWSPCIPPGPHDSTCWIFAFQSQHWPFPTNHYDSSQIATLALPNRDLKGRLKGENPACTIVWTRGDAWRPRQRSHGLTEGSYLLLARPTNFRVSLGEAEEAR